MKRSKQEEFFATLYPEFKYEPCTFDYVRYSTYTPDFRLGTNKRTNLPVYLELKEFLPYEDIPKYRAIVSQYEGIFELWFLVRNMTLKTKNSLCNFATRVYHSDSCLLPQSWKDDLE